MMYDCRGIIRRLGTVRGLRVIILIEESIGGACACRQDGSPCLIGGFHADYGYGDVPDVEVLNYADVES